MRYGLLRKILVIGIVTLFFGASWMTILSGNVSVVAAGDTIYVDDDNTGGPWDGTPEHPYQNITSALQHASVNDTIYVYNGTYYENLVVNKSVSLIGENKYNTIIDGMSGARGIDITVNNVTVEGFNITNSYYGIYTNASGFSIIGNIFWYDNYGFYWKISETSLAEDYTVYDGVVKNNEFYMNTNNYALYAYVKLDYNYSSPYDVKIGDIAISNNTFHMDGTSATGIFVRTYVENLYGENVSVGALNMSENRIYGGSWGINFYGTLDEVKDVQASVGDVMINNNVMVNQSSYGMYIDYYGATNWNGTTTGTYGDFIVKGNKITSVYSAEGIYVSDIGYWEYFAGNARLEVGDLYIEENEIDVGGKGIYIYYYYGAYDFYNNASVTMQNVYIRNNTIYGSSYGIDIDIEDCGESLYDDSSTLIGDIIVANNTINSSDNGIDFYAYTVGYDMYGNSSFTMGNSLVNDNNINSGNYGIYIYFYKIGYEMNGNSSFTMGNTEFNGNEINSTNDGIYIYFYKTGYYMYDNSSFTMGNIQFNGNTINSDDDGMYINYIGYFGYYMYGNSSSTMGNIEFSGNVINSTYDGIYINELWEFGNYMYDNSSSVMGDILVNNNILNSDDDGIYVEYIMNLGKYIYGNSSFAMGNIEFSGNAIISSNAGMNLTDLENATIRNNIIQNCSYGIYLQNSTNNSIYHNNFINNTFQANVTAGYANTWDNGYPSGGNYWSDYTDIDQNSGPYQNETGSDGIWDNPYVIDVDNNDTYPFTSTWAWDITPPSIGTVSQEPDIPDEYENVTITVDVTDEESKVRNVTISYSTDGGETWNNVTMEKTTGDTYEGEIPGLPAETQVQYEITAYDNAGNPYTEDNDGKYYVYTVIPEFPSVIILPLFMFLALIAVALAKKIRCKAIAKTT